MKTLYKILIATIVSSFAIPLFASAYFVIPWTATSTTQNWVFPLPVNGVQQTVVGNNFIATSTIATSTFAGTVGVGTDNPMSGTASIGSRGLDVERINDGGTILRLGNLGSTYYDFKRDNSTGQLSLQGSQAGFNNIILAPTSGNIGIGTTSPYATLSVVGGSGVVADHYTATSTTLSSFGTPTANVKLGTFQDNSNSYAGMYFNQATPNNTNYGFLGNSTDVFLNAATGVHLRVVSNSDEILTGTANNVAIPTGNKFISGGATAGAQLQSNVTPAIGTYSLSNWNSSGQITPAAFMVPTTNGGNTLTSTFPALILGRDGVAGQAYPNFAEFKIGKYTTVGTNAKTQLDIALTDGDAANAGTNIISLQSGGNVGVGTTTPDANLQVANATANATTTIDFGKANQNKGTCVKFYRTDGSAIYMAFAAGATNPTFTTTACATVTNF